MPIHRKYALEIASSIEAELRTSLFGSLEFLNQLDEDDDWSFVIKAQAIVEAAVTEAVVAKLGETAIKGTVERLPLADEQIGKLALAKELDLMTKEQRRFVRKMAELRNRLAHRVQDIDFKFSTYFETLNAQQRKDWRESVAWFAAGKESQQGWLESAQENPRLTLYLAVFMLLAMLHVARVQAETPRKIDAAALRTAEDLFATFADRKTDG